PEGARELAQGERLTNQIGGLAYRGSRSIVVCTLRQEGDGRQRARGGQGPAPRVFVRRKERRRNRGGMQEGKGSRESALDRERHAERRDLACRALRLPNPPQREVNAKLLADASKTAALLLACSMSACTPKLSD